MVRKTTKEDKKNSNGGNLGFEEKLWQAADKMFSDEEISRIAQAYHAWRGEKEAGKYKDIPGFCKSIPIEEIRVHGYVLTPGRYVGAEDIEDDTEPFDEKMKRLTSNLKKQFEKAHKLELIIKKNFESIGFKEG
jgi:type I restriction enzyme M protein